MQLSLMRYVEWLHKGENMKLHAAREKARSVWSKQTGQLIPLEWVLTPDEFREIEKEIKLRSLH